MGDEPDYRALAQTLLRQKNLLLEGVPGTGKTYAVSKIVDELRSHLADAESGPRGVGGDGAGDFAVTMHPSTSYEDFVEGLKPTTGRHDCTTTNDAIRHRIPVNVGGETLEVDLTVASNGDIAVHHHDRLQMFEHGELASSSLHVLAVGQPSPSNRKKPNFPTQILPETEVTDPGTTTSRNCARGFFADLFFDSGHSLSHVAGEAPDWLIPSDSNNVAEEAVIRKDPGIQIQFLLDNPHLDRAGYDRDRDKIRAPTGFDGNTEPKRFAFLFELNQTAPNQMGIKLLDVKEVRREVRIIQEKFGQNQLENLTQIRGRGESVHDVMDPHWIANQNGPGNMVFFKVIRRYVPISSKLPMARMANDPNTVVVFSMDCCDAERVQKDNEAWNVVHADVSMAHFRTMTCEEAAPRDPDEESFTETITDGTSEDVLTSEGPEGGIIDDTAQTAAVHQEEHGELSTSEEEEHGASGGESGGV